MKEDSITNEIIENIYKYSSRISSFISSVFSAIDLKNNLVCVKIKRQDFKN